MIDLTPNVRAYLRSLAGLDDEPEQPPAPSGSTWNDTYEPAPVESPASAPPAQTTPGAVYYGGSGDDAGYTGGGSLAPQQLPAGAPADPKQQLSSPGATLTGPVYTPPSQSEAEEDARRALDASPQVRLPAPRSRIEIAEQRQQAAAGRPDPYAPSRTSVAGGMVAGAQAIPGALVAGAEAGARTAVRADLADADPTRWATEGLQAASGLVSPVPTQNPAIRHMLSIYQAAVDAFGDRVGREVWRGMGGTDEELFTVLGMPVTKEDVAGFAGQALVDPTNYVGAPAAARAGGRVVEAGVRAGREALEQGAESVVQGGRRLASDIGQGLERNAERVAAADARMAQQGSTVAPMAVGAGPQRMYHGTAGAFGRPDPGKFDEHGLFGPGYYLTSDPRVASSYAEARAVGAEGVQAAQNAANRMIEIDGELGSLRGVPATESRISSLEREREALESRWGGVDVTPTGQNVRAVDVPGDLNLLDLDQTLRQQPALLDTFEQAMGYPAMIERFRNAMRSQVSSGKMPTAEDAWRAFEDTYRSTYQSGAVYDFLHHDLKSVGFDGITHTGGRRVPLMDDAGKPINHDVTIVFPHALDKIRNAFSGEVGGMSAGALPPFIPGRGVLGAVNQAAAESFSGGFTGAAAGAALDPDDPQRGAARGFATGALGAPVAVRGARALARRAGGSVALEGAAAMSVGGLPNQPLRRRLRTQAIPDGARPITSTDAADVSRLRLDKFPEEVRDLIEAGAREGDFARTQRRGIISDDLAQQMAQDDARSVDQIIQKGRAGRSYNAEETLALRNAAASQADTVRSLSDEIAEARANGITPDLLIARRAAEATRLNGLIQIAEGARAEAGRTLRAYRQQARLIELDPSQAIQQIYKRLGGRDNAEAAIDEYTKLVNDGANPIQLAKFWARVESGKITAGDLFGLFRRFNMLSGPRTVEVNALGGAVNLGYEVASQALGQATRGRLAEAGAEFAAPFKAAGRAFQNMAETAQHGVSMEQAARGDIPRSLSARTDNPLAKGALTVMETPDRVNAAVDQFYRTMTEDWAATRLAQRQAREAGIRPGFKDWTETVAKNVETIRDDPTKFAEIKEMADRVTFSDEPGAVGKGLEAFRQKAPVVANLLFPFIRTPYNIASRAVDLSPLGIVRTGIETATGLGQGRQNVSRRLRDNTVGMGAAVWAYSQAQQGNVTGAGPDDPEKLAELRATGWQPYSVKLGNQYWSYANFAPFSLALASGAAAYEAQKYAKPGKTDTLSMLADGAERTGKVVTEMTVLAGLGAVVKSIQDPDRYGGKWLSQFLQTLIPAGSLLNTIGQATDPVMRRAERDTFANQVTGDVLARIPPNPLTPDRTDVPAAQDPLGRPVPNEQTGLGALNPFRPTTERSDPVLHPFIDAGVDIGKPPAKIDNVVLTPAQQRAWLETRGEYLIGRQATLSSLGALPLARRQERLRTYLDFAADRAETSTRRLFTPEQRADARKKAS